MKYLKFAIIFLFFNFNLHAQNHRPVANAGEDITVRQCDEIKLSGSGTDEDGDKLSYYWEIPDELKKVLSSQNDILYNKINFDAPALEKTTSFTIKLYVSDGMLVSEPDELKLTIQRTQNTAPVISIENPASEMQEYPYGYFECDVVELSDKEGDHIFVYAQYGNEKPRYFYNTDYISFTNNVNQDTIIQLKIWAQDCELSSEVQTFDVKIINDTIPDPVPYVNFTYNKQNEIFGYRKYQSKDTLDFSVKLSGYSTDEITKIDWDIDSRLDTFHTKKNGFSCIIPDISHTDSFMVSVQINTFDQISISDSIQLDAMTKESYIEYCVIKAYDMLRSRQLFGLDFQHMHYLLDDRILTDQEDIFGLGFNAVTGSSINGILKGILRNIHYCNKLIDICNESVLSDASLLISELKFLRALNLFYGNILYQDFPLFTDQSIGTLGYHPFLFVVNELYESSKEDIVYQIKMDLLSAIAGLPVSNTKEKFRATKTSAQALLGKVYLYNQEWDYAKIEFEKVINSGRYSLIKPLSNEKNDYLYAFGCNFSPIDLPAGNNVYKSEFNSESIIEIPFSSGAMEDWDDYNEFLPGWTSNTSLLNKYFYPSQGWEPPMTDTALIQTFEQVDNHTAGFTYDPRRYMTLWEQGDEMFVYNHNKSIYKNRVYNPYVYGRVRENSIHGLKKNYFLIDETYNPQASSVNNWRLLRFSDLLLMHAEACYHTGDTATGLKSLNAVRNRVGMPSINQLTPDAIIHERDVELAGECIRYHDLIRWSLLPEPWVNLEDIDQELDLVSDQYLPLTDELNIPEFNTVFIPANRKSGEVIGEFSFIARDTKAELTTYNGFELDNHLFEIEDKSLITLEDLDWEKRKYYTISYFNSSKSSNISKVNLKVARQLDSNEFKIIALDDSTTKITFRPHNFDIYGKINKYYFFRLANDIKLPEWMSTNEDSLELTIHWNEMTLERIGNSSGKLIDYTAPFEIFIIERKRMAYGYNIQNEEAVFIEIAPLGDLIEYHSELAQYVSTYPNPTKSTLNVKISLQDEDVSYFRFDLYDLQGNIVRSEIRYQNPELLKMDVNNLTHGVYLLRSQVGTNVETKKIIVE